MTSVSGQTLSPSVILITGATLLDENGEALLDENGVPLEALSGIVTIGAGGVSRSGTTYTPTITFLGGTASVTGGSSAASVSGAIITPSVQFLGGQARITAPQHGGGGGSGKGKGRGKPRRTLLHEWEEEQAALLARQLLHTVEKAIDKPTPAAVAEVRQEARTAGLTNLLTGIPQAPRPNDRAEVRASLRAVADELRAIVEAREADDDDEDALAILL